MGSKILINIFSSIFKSFFDSINEKNKGNTRLADIEKKAFIVHFSLILSQQKGIEKYSLIEGIF